MTAGSQQHLSSLKCFRKILVRLNVLTRGLLAYQQQQPSKALILVAIPVNQKLRVTTSQDFF